MNAIEMLKRHERYMRFPYRCPAGKLTIGYGWNLEENGITEAEATYMLEGQVRAAVRILSAEPYWLDLNDARQAILIDMTVNMGWPKFALFKRMRAALDKRDYQLAAAEMMDSNWYAQVGTRSKRLVGMMRSGKWATDLS